MSYKTFGAEGGTRTRTGLLPHAPETCASTNSTTSAWLFTGSTCIDTCIIRTGSESHPGQKRIISGTFIVRCHLNHISP
jgi:hypothetical protein